MSTPVAAGLIISVPSPNTANIFAPGTNIPILAIATAYGGPDGPPVFLNVTIQVDNDPVVTLEQGSPYLTFTESQGGLHPLTVGISYGLVPQPDGPHTVTIRAEFSNSRKYAFEDVASFVVGALPPPPLVSQFTGTAVFQTSYSAVEGDAFPVPFSIQLTFSGDLETVTITDFPPITTPSFSVPLGSDTITVTLTGGGTGTFDHLSGVMQIPVTLNFHNSDSLVCDSDLSVRLSTGREHSPHGYFNDFGSPMGQHGPGIITLS
jgi:hypothetical protein